MAALFVATGELGHLLAIPPGLATPIWLPSGISVTAFILLGMSVWPGVYAGATIVSALPLLRTGNLEGAGFALAMGALIAIPVTLEPFIAAYIYRRSSTGSALLARSNNVAALLLKAGPISCICAATLASTILGVSGAMPWERFGETWLTWMTGDLAGIYMLAPILLTFTAGDTVRLGEEDRTLIPLAIVALVGASIVSFVDESLIGFSLRLAFLPFPLVVLLAYRFNDRLASLTGSSVAAVAILATANGLGPFGDQPVNIALIELQVFTLVGIMTALFTRAIANERDAAERESQQLSAGLAHLSRVTLMGELAAGMAHEYHQPLTAISNYASAALILMRRNDGMTREVGDLLQHISDESMRAAGIVNHLKDFLQKRPPQRAPCDANAIAADAVRLVRMAHSFPRATLTCRLAQDLPLAHVDGVQITQIIFNLLLNSCEAIENGDGTEGTVRVTTQPDGPEHIRVWVEDNGPGMSPEAERACFDQFFSTKSGGLGIGLGISRTLANAHGGTLTLESTGSRGTRFCLSLPTRNETGFG